MLLVVISPKPMSSVSARFMVGEISRSSSGFMLGLLVKTLSCNISTLEAKWPAHHTVLFLVTLPATPTFNHASSSLGPQASRLPPSKASTLSLKQHSLLQSFTVLYALR